MQVTTLKMTSAEFDIYTSLPENAGNEYELIHGELLEMPSPTTSHAKIVVAILLLLGRFIEENDIEGDLIHDNLDHRLAEDVIVKPDVSLVLKDHIRTDGSSYPTVSPDLVVEIISPSNSPGEIAAKIQIYFQYGAQLIWIVYPDTKQVQVYRKTAAGNIEYQSLNADDTISGEPVLPGFSAKVIQLFPKPPQAREG